jgi:hypothetical protein
MVLFMHASFSDARARASLAFDARFMRDSLPSLGWMRQLPTEWYGNLLTNFREEAPSIFLHRGIEKRSERELGQ